MDDDFRAYVATRGPALLRSAVLLTGDRGHAEDLVQTALIKVHARWGRIREPAAVDAYVRRAMLTTYLNWWRRRWRGEVPTERLPEAPTAGEYARVEDGLPDAEIAAVLGCSAVTVRTQASRALAKLRADGTLADLAPGVSAPTEKGTDR